MLLNPAFLIYIHITQNICKSYLIRFIILYKIISYLLFFRLQCQIELNKKIYRQFISKQDQKRPLDKPERMIERREKRCERERYIYRERV